MSIKNETKKLLIISLHADPSMPPGVGEWGGTHTYMRELLTELADTNYEIILITRKVYAEEKDIEEISPSTHILRLTLGDFGDFDKRELFNLHEETLRKSLEKLNELDFKPDIIHSVYWNSGHLANKLSKQWNIPYVHSVISNGRGRNAHGASGTAPNRIETEMKVFQNATYILCVADSEKEEICKLYDIPSKKVIVAGQYVHPAFMNAAHNRNGEPRASGIDYKIKHNYLPYTNMIQSIECEWWNKQVFTYTGRLSLDKGLEFIFQAWHILEVKYKEKCPPLWIIGGNASDIQTIRPQLGIDIKELSILENKGKIVWWGYLDEVGISTIYMKTLVLITHSKYEPGGRVAIEAMCEGVPVLATPNGFALDSIQDWDSGFLIPFKDVSTLAIRMEHFIKQPLLSDYMGIKAKAVGQSIVTKWAFKESHLASYHHAVLDGGNMEKVNNVNALESNFKARYMSVFPYNMNLVDSADIIQIMHNNGIKDIDSIRELEVLDATSMIWEVETKYNVYYVKLPYDRINYFNLWGNFNEQQNVISALSRYKAEISATSLSEIPSIAGKDDFHYAIIREKYIAKDIPLNLQIIEFIDKLHAFYRNNAINDPDLTKQFTKFVAEQCEYDKADACYIRQALSLNPAQYYFMDYSLNVEAERWFQYFNALHKSQQDEIKNIFNKVYKKVRELAKEESKFKIILNHGGCDYKNLLFDPKAILLDNEKIHIGFPGIDYADFLITFAQKNYQNDTVDMWKEILSFIPEEFISRHMIIGWLLMSICKQTVSQITCLSTIEDRVYKRAESLLKLSTFNL